MRALSLIMCFAFAACPAPDVGDGGGGADTGTPAQDADAPGGDAAIALDATLPTPTDGGNITRADGGGVLPPVDGGGVVIVDAGGGGGLNCIEGMQCMLDCGADRSCLGRCLERVDAEQRGVTEAVAACAQRHRCEDANCIMANCQREAEACGEASGGGGPGPQDGGVIVGDVGGDGTSCIDGLTCMANCRAGDRACVARCISGVEPQQRDAIQAVATCAQRHNCQNPNCILENCQRETQACGAAGGGQPPNPGGDGGGGPPQPGDGDSTCAEFVQCIDGCNPRDRQCPDTCMRNVRPQSADLANALVQCMMRSQCRDMTCVRARCADQMRPCMADRN